MGARTLTGDLADYSAVSQAAKGAGLVFHVASKTGIWGPLSDFRRTNVTGTENIIKACREHGAARLVYTSTPSVVHRGGDVRGVDESAPYPESFEAYYPQTKAEAEQMVLKANGDGLSTAALRPHLVWGPGDPNFAPRLIERARSGRLRKVSGGPYLVDSVYIDNAAEAHLLAADSLAQGRAAGKAYFISQGQPIDIGELIDRILAAAGLPPVRKTISPRAVYAAGVFFESLYTLLRLQKEPPMTRFVAKQLSTAHWFDLGAARKDLGYIPRVSLDEGFRRLAAHLGGA